MPTFPFDTKPFQGQYVAYSPLLKSVVANADDMDSVYDIVEVQLKTDIAKVDIFFVPIEGFWTAK